MPTTACIIQGDIRTNKIDIIIDEMSSQFDHVILSTWKGEESKFKEGAFHVILNDPPETPGGSHRNYQRLSTANGLRKARSLGAEYVMKWRTDLLPTALDLQNLIAQCNEQVSEQGSSRVVIPAFRNLTVKPDFFSSFPDHFAFGHIDEMEYLWGDEGFNYTRSFNVPDQKSWSEEVSVEDGKILFKGSDYTYAYDAHVECYALYKGKLEDRYGKSIDHPEIVKKHLKLIDHNDLKICWFDKDESFRSITQALMFPWWTADTPKSGKYKTWVPGYKIDGVRHFFGVLKSNRAIEKSKKNQKEWLNKYFIENGK